MGTGTVQHDERIHYTQRLYRSLLDTMARPGSLIQLEPYAYSGCPSEHYFRIGIALTLLDQEVSFHETATEKELTQHLQLLTRSTAKPLSESDYIFVQSGEAPDLTEAKRGTDLYPDQSATIVCQVKRIAQDGNGEVRLKLKGPGIQTARQLSLDGFSPDLLPELIASSEQFPLGLDWILVDAEGRLCCLPRSTKIVKEA
ncbi:phosphonate C-P lyase system protein PhnH [Paenibacillus sp. SYP-B3998]|uniref:Phosphonate C-P lyase system protein PhnH n=1 Tax=Paenibacillus sp. SYP-B3998 TaxID=2678564 RepID=A0A6G4A2F1_9BACL|nr:phosphonate C-P lyase system protein PhnH [Paenibacillus sp. SYP-B3998]NEW08114.1 phosphonate C-P lyase system protein PhnH [Paenibacillus sp. SYP-B3998]